MQTGEYNESLPKSKRKEFKTHTEKLKKFDDMIKEFPKNLATPIDVPYLRKIVRQEKSNKSRREKRMGVVTTTGGSAASGEKKEQQHDSEIIIPQRGLQFSSVPFKQGDFEDEDKWVLLQRGSDIDIVHCLIIK